MLKKILSTLLAMLMLVTMAAPALAEYAEDDLIEVTVATWLMDESFVEANDPVYQMIQKRFGIKITPISMSWSGYQERVGVWMSTGDMPDVITVDGMTGGNSMLESTYTWIDDGLLMPIPVDAEKYPNLAARYEDPMVQAMAVDGQYYCIPRYKGDSTGNSWANNRATYYRKDWAKQLGFEEIKTWDEFVAFARALKDSNIEGMQYAIGGSADNIHWYLWPTFEPRLWGFWVEDENGLYRAFNSEHTYDAAKAVRELYNEGLIDPDVVVKSTNSNVFYDDFAAGKTGILCGSQMFSLDAVLWDKMVGLNPDKTLEEMIGVIPMLPNIYDGTEYCYDYNANSWAETFITSNVAEDEEKFNRIMAFLDYTSSEEWFDIYIYGIEGVDYEKVNGEVKYLTEDGQRPDMMTKYPVLNGINELTMLYEGRRFALLTTKYDHMRALYDEIYFECQDRVPIPISSATFLISTPADEGFVDTSGDALRLYLFSPSDEDPAEAWAKLQQQLIDDGVIDNMNAKVEAAREAGRLAE